MVGRHRQIFPTLKIRCPSHPRVRITKVHGKKIGFNLKRDLCIPAFPL
jgi:hypothetical protein